MARITRTVTRDESGNILHDSAVSDVRPPSSVLRSPPSEPLPEPTKAEMIGHAGSAFVKWAAAGFAIAPPEIRAARYAACLACSFWDDSARLGLGKCKHPGCGCTKLKLALATEKCPLDRWAS